MICIIFQSGKIPEVCPFFFQGTRGETGTPKPY